MLTCVYLQFTFAFTMSIQKYHNLNVVIMSSLFKEHLSEKIVRRIFIIIIHTGGL